MRVLFTGGASPLGSGVLRCVLENEAYDEVWCGIHRQAVPVKYDKLRLIELQLEDQLNLKEIPRPIDLVIHFAGVTHAQDEQTYWRVNLDGTRRLVESARAMGCRRFVYVSTRCATAGSGAYGESKRAAEKALQKFDWDSLLILRPAEVYGSGGREGIDRFLRLADRFHVVPLLWGHSGLRFAPLHAEDFIAMTCALLREDRRGVQVLDMCGPEDFNGAVLALRIAQRRHALPLPLWWPALSIGLRALRLVGLQPVKPDQVARLLGRKTANHSTLDPLLNRKTTRFMWE